MKKRTAIITGSTSGIGLGIAQAFAEKEYNIVFNGLEENGAEIASDVACKYNIDFLFSQANMLNPAELRELVSASISAFGAIDVLVNNAGIQHVSPVENFPEEKWNEIINTNLSAVFHLAKAVWPHMKAKQFGRIINIASIHGLFASEFKTAYVAAKHGVVGLTKALALEGAPFNITCNAICPGYVKTRLVEKQIDELAALHHLPEDEVAVQILLKKQAVKEFVPVQSVAALALYLASEQASTVTGTAIPLDGGWSAQ